MLRLNESNLKGILKAEELSSIEPFALLAARELREKSSPGSDYLGWLDWPKNMESDLLARIEQCAAKIRKNSDVLVSIGIGGSFLGAKAIYEALKLPFEATLPGGVELVFAGQNLSGRYLDSLLSYLKDKDFSLNVISKSGTTTEPALAFRLLRELLVEKYGEESFQERIFCTTDARRGALKTFADKHQLTSFVIPDDIGGRYSVLTPVGLLPLAAAGVEVEALIAGAELAYAELAKGGVKDNPAYRYAAIRNCLYNKGYRAENLVTFEPELSFFAEWWKQLFGESEGKDGKGLLPTSMQFTRDLHSLGQFVQDGQKSLFETCLVVNNQADLCTIPEDLEDTDGLNYLAGMTLPEINLKARQATLLAHHSGGVPVLEICLDSLDAKHLGYLIYFFELACAVSARMLGVNPFDQPGVEDYKVNMFALLGKPGFAEKRAELEALIAEVK